MDRTEPAVKIRPAATVMLARDSGNVPEIYMLRRSPSSAFLPEVFVFPGGAVDALDAELARSRLLRNAEAPNSERESADPAFEVAALREAFEEAGILLTADSSGYPAILDDAQLRKQRTALHAGTTTLNAILEAFGVVLDSRRLWHFSHWITPPTESHRFDTHFYLAFAPPGQAASSDEIETHAGLWISPADALRRNADGNFPMIFPTIMHLQRLAPYTTLDAMHGFAMTKSIYPVEPVQAEPRRFMLPDGLDGRW
ncbi:MAG TPA: NUDIX hydrolase [Candidatus Baltobacteraceae bacterium]